MQLKFDTKAITLKNLKEVISSAMIAPMYILYRKNWENEKLKSLSKIKSKLGIKDLIVRSSCKEEDSLLKSNAGVFKTILNVKESNLEDSISEVFKSYRSNKNEEDEDEVLIQPMLENVVRSGVAFSHDPNSGSPYRVINWSESSDTTKVTSGLGGNIWHQAAKSPIKPDKKFRPIIQLIDELLLLYNRTPINLEFAITKEFGEETIWLLQVRPLIINSYAEGEIEDEQEKKLNLIYQKLVTGMQPNPFLIGEKNVYGVMPDWNPAEIIGIRPKPLSLSLYRDLVTDSIWAYQRNNYGYRNLRSFPLMVNFFGLPYVDVRVSFNSFIPADLEDKLAGKLVGYYIDCLIEEPTLHDKVEFEIVYSCYTLDLKERLNNLNKFGFSQSEREIIKTSLLKLTNNIIHPDRGLWKKDSAKIDILRSKRENLINSESPLLEKIYWLIEDAKRYGTLPFAGLARSGFIAVQILRSLVNVGFFSKKESDLFLGDITTIGGQLKRDRAVFDKYSFFEKYGHLRPGTYDILTPRYDEQPDIYFDWSHKPEVPEVVEPFSLSIRKMEQMAQLLKQHQLEIDVVAFFDFIRSGIKSREKSKFYFTKNLSDVLSLIKELGIQYDISPEDLAYCNINTIKDLAINTNNIKDTLLRDIENGKSNYEDTKSIILPPLITSPKDVWQFNWPKTEPNYITMKSVTASVSNYEKYDNFNISDHQIICIPNADPGFDWLFSYDLAGLVTAWGGANSHMAIRAFELGIPAVIGVGDILYQRYSKAKRLFIDCSTKRVEILH